MTKYPLLILIIVFIIVFSPILSFVFSLKNDMFLGYFPPRYLLGETLFSKQMPIWNPYISYGLPFYGDMNGAYWSPITWLIALTSGYNVYTLTLEVLFYLLFGGVGMYFLSKHFTLNKYVSLISALAYMCNGYNIGHLQHLNWISGASFLPWCIWGFMKINSESKLRDFFTTTLFLYLLISSSHPGIIISAFYFFFSFFFYYLINSFKKGSLVNPVKILKINSFLFFLIILICSGILFGYSDIIPHFSRNTKINIEAANTASTTFESLISFILPFSTTKNNAFFETDISMRNCYFSIILFIFFLHSLFSKKNKQQYFFLFTGLFFLVISSNTIIKDFAYRTIPLLGYIRLSGEFRIFSILSFIILAVIELNKFFPDSKILPAKLFQISKAIRILLLIFLLSACYQIFINKDSILFNLNQSSPNQQLVDLLKYNLDHLSFYDTILIQSIIQLLILSAFVYILKRGSLKILVLLFIIDTVSATFLNLPYTGVGKTPLKEIDAIHNISGRGIHSPKLQPVFKNDTLSQKDSALVGEWSFYNRQIGSSKRIIYPVLLKTTLKYYNSIEKDSTINIKKYPYIFIASKIDHNRIFKDSTQSIYENDIVSFSTNNIHLKFIANRIGLLVFLQNKYPHWYYKKDNKYYTVNNAGYTFFCVPVVKGNNDIEVVFKPRFFYLFFYVSFSTFILFILAALLIKKQTNIFS